MNDMSSFSGSFRLLDPTHPLYWSRSTSGDALILQTSYEPSVKSIKLSAVEMTSWKQADGKWAVGFSLVNPAFGGMFDRFCEDMVESSRGVSEEKGADFAISRFKRWKKMFSADGSLLTNEEILGLMGEIVSMEQILIPKYGEAVALRAWMNKRAGKQDFVFKDSWYEVKSHIEGVGKVTITSLEQLDCDDEGYMIVVTFRKTSPESQRGCSLNELVERFEQDLSTESAKDMFADTLEVAGYSYDSRYDEFCYDCVCLDEYRVDANFPRLRRSRLSSAIVSGSYEVAIDSLSEFLVKRWN